MKFSIVTVSFNQARFLEQTIRSVLDQDHPDVEYIVVDPGSTDGSREIVERYRDRISTVLFAPDRGPADGLNNGFGQANGDVYGFLNADDYLLPGALTAVASRFSEMPDREVLSGHALIVDADGREINRFISRRFSLTRFVYGASTLAPSSTFFKAELFHRVGGFNIDNHTAWDGELWTDFALHGARFGRVPVFLSAFRLPDSSIAGNSDHREASARNDVEIFVKAKGRSFTRADRLLHYAYERLEHILRPAVAQMRLRRGPIVPPPRA